MALSSDSKDVKNLNAKLKWTAATLEKYFMILECNKPTANFTLENKYFSQTI